ncbi:MAG TPA: NAD(P)/FAD-dependent oxidoreductase, partial [Puia sp.]
MKKKAIIIGAGPAGLTAAYELLKRTDIIPVILEKSGDIGGISKTINYKGNRMDMGPHRFFSKSERVMNWWLQMMPLQESADSLTISYQNKTREINTVNSNDAISSDSLNDTDATIQGKKDPDKVMLVIQRLTRIYFLRKFFAYPIQLGFDTLKTLGLVRTIKIMVSFLWIRLFPIKEEKSLEDFIINKFGKQLYLLFFKDYTEKVWGVPCHEISAEWGAQRIKGVSLSKAIAQALKTMVRQKKGKGDINQKGTETSLIEQFLYPKKGPGSLWEETARQIEEMGGKIYFHQDVQRIYTQENAITSVNTINSQTGQTGAWEGDYFFSTMPVQELVAGMEADVPSAVREVAAGLQYRDFINVGILLRQLSSRNKAGGYEKLELKDNWIYIQERDVKVGRLMIYNNWGDGMIKDPNTTWIGMEYFCNKTDAFWALSDEAIQQTAIQELEKMDLANVEDVLDITVRRMEKTYPAYFGTYERFGEIRSFTDQFENLFLVGRNGMHKYNNADHSMLCSMVAVDNIEAGITSKANLWSINTEQEYHEEKTGVEQSREQEGREYELLPSFLDYVWRNKGNRAYLLFALAAFLV